jgi:hypothetical protein
LIEVKGRVFVSNPNIAANFARENELQNGGLEAIYGEPPVYWWQWAQNCKPTFLYPEPGRIGGSAIAIRIVEFEPFKPGSEAIWGQDVAIEAGKSYVIGGWVKTSDVEGAGGAMIVPGWKGPGNTWISLTPIMPYLKGTNGWNYYQGSVIAPPGATICNVCCLMSGCSGTAWYDDLLFEEK